MQTFWIIGFGRVGRRALKRLQDRAHEADITVVDPRYSHGPTAAPDNVHWHAEDGVSFLVRRLTRHGDPSPWIVPALPLHLAYEWLAAALTSYGRFEPMPVPEAVAAELPNAVRGPEGQLYISIADFRCPDTCSEPHGKCPVTGSPRLYDLHAHLAGLHHAVYRSLVIRSHQLAPGLGGYRARRLTDALDTVRANPSAWLFSTASKCHGVMHAFAYEKQDSRGPGSQGPRVND
jgi:hypothetical protein